MNKVILSFLFFFFISLIGRTQSVADTVFIYIENRVEMKITIKDYHQLRDSNGVANNLRKFQSYFPSISDQLNKEDAEKITFQPDSSITVKKVDKDNIFLIQEESILNTGFRDQLLINSGAIQINIITSDISSIGDIKLADCFEKMIAILPPKTRVSRSLYFKCKNGTVSLIEEKDNTANGAGDIIEITASAGAGLFKNQWIGDFNIRLGIGLFRKEELNHYPYLSASLLYDFPTSNRTNINTFLNLGYRWKLSEESDSKTMGAEFGYLISRRGNTFNKNTFRFGLNWSPIDAVSVSPQIYFSNGFKEVTPGIRIGFGF